MGSDTERSIFSVSRRSKPRGSLSCQPLRVTELKYSNPLRSVGGQGPAERTGDTNHRDGHGEWMRVISPRRVGGGPLVGVTRPGVTCDAAGGAIPPS